MTDAELAEIRERVEKATPGPWVTRPVSELWDGDYEGSNGCNLWLATEWKGAKGPNLGADEMLNQDAEFTAHARQDIPALLDELAAARKENERLREAAEAALPLLQTHSCWHDVFPELDCCEYGLVAEQLSVALGNEPLPIYAEYLHSAKEDADDRTT